MTVTTVPLPAPARRSRTFGVRLAFLLTGALMGITGTLLVTYDGDSSGRPAAAETVPSAGNASAVHGPRLSADAAERWAIAERAATPSFTSADAAERHATTEQKTRIDLSASAPTSADGAERCVTR